MRACLLIPLSWLCILQVILGFGNSNVFAGSSTRMAVPVAETLTNIAGCLDHVRNDPNRTAPLRVEASITLIDRERSLVVLQDDSAAMGVYMSLSGLALMPGQKVIVEGNGISPYVRAFPAYPDEPSERHFLNAFETPSGRGTYYLDRIRGCLHPPVSGLYTFWIAADDAGEAWLSTNASPEGMQKIAENRVGNAVGLRDWSHYASQRSQPVMLKAGEAYYIEALHMQSYGRNNMGVAWEGPGIKRSVVEGHYLTPWDDHSVLDEPLPTNGLLWECWTNFFLNDFDSLRAQSPHESIVRIQDLKLTMAGEGDLPVPQRIDPGASFDTVPNLRWVELEGDVDFAAGTGDKLQFELKREGAVLEVHILDWKEPPIERLVHSHIRIQGVLEHSYGTKGELTNNVLWVPNDRQVSLLAPEDNQNPDLNRVAICDIEPTDPEMSWGRRVSVRGQIINRTKNGLVVLEGSGNFQAFCSADGTNWVSLGRPVEIGMSNSVLGGLAVVARHDKALTTASFSNPVGLGTNWLGADIGQPARHGNFSVRNGTLTVTGGGRKLGDRADQLYYLCQPLQDKGQISARLTDLIYVNSRTQVGLMERESLDANSPFAAVLFAPASGPAFVYRSALGNSIIGFEAKPEYRKFRWLKLVRLKSLLQVQGDPGPGIGTNQDVDVTGMITWQNNIPVLTDAFFQSSQAGSRITEPVVDEPQQSIASFVDQALHPSEADLLGRISSPVLHGIVTFCGEFLGQNLIFVQSGDDGGIQVGWLDGNARPEFEVGQLVEMRGFADVREFPVVLDLMDLKVVGWGTLPTPDQYSSVLVKSGSGQAKWVEATGVVRSAGTNGLLSLMTKDGVLAVWVGQRQGLEPREYVDTLVRVRGVLSMDSSHIARLLVPSPDFVEVQERAPADPYMIPRFTIAQLAALDLRAEQLRRMKLSGVVTCCLPEGIYVQDDTGGAYVQTDEATLFHPGDRVEAVGFPNDESTPLVITDASVRKSSEGTLPNPMRVSLDKLLEKKFAGMLVSLEGVVLEQRDTPEAQLLTLQIGTKIFEAGRVTEGDGRLPPIPTGSRVAITGVCQIDPGATSFGVPESEADQTPESFKILLPDPASVVILERPPWWTMKRVAWLGGLFGSGFLVALIWLRLLRRRVAERTRELRAAMLQLEKETSTSATLAERDRLAAEIHDSLEQGLTAIMLQLDATNKYVDHFPEARRFLDMARNMAEFSRVEVQHAVWDMQSPLLANANLATALKHVAAQIGSGLTGVTVEIIGSPRPLPSSHGHHLLRIAQEAMTNALKHGQARTVIVTLDYSGQELKLVIADDGSGFIPDAAKPQWQSGHFGLQSIRARAKKIGAKLDIASQAGKGTTITVWMRTDHKDAAASSKEKSSL